MLLTDAPLATWITIVSGAISILAALIITVRWGVRQVQGYLDEYVTGRIDQVLHEVKTVNGITLGALADFQEGRRIKVAVPDKNDRTTSEQIYVDRVEDAGREHLAPRPALPPYQGTV